MKPIPQPAVSLALLALVLAVGRAGAETNAPAASPAAVAVAARTNSITSVVRERLSVFDPDAPGAKNLFYPGAAKVLTSPVVDDEESYVAAFSQLSLKGLVSGRSAIINNRNFVKGDEGPVRLSGGRQITVKVVEIHEDGVMVVLGGQKEARKLYVRGAGR